MFTLQFQAMYSAFQEASAGGHSICEHLSHRGHLRCYTDDHLKPTHAEIPPAGEMLWPQPGTDRFVFSEQPSRLRPGEGDGLGGERCRVNVATHQNVHLLLSLHLRLLGVKAHLVSGRLLDMVELAMAFVKTGCTLKPLIQLPEEQNHCKLFCSMRMNLS